MLLPKITYLPCPRHPDESSSLLCLEPDCPQRGIICPECGIFDHRLHLTKPIVLVLREMAFDAGREVPLRAIMKIDFLQLRFQRLIYSLDSERRLIQPQLNAFFSSIHKNLQSYLCLGQNILNFREANTQFGSLMRRYKLHDREEGDLDKTNFEIYAENLLLRINQRLDDFEQQLAARAGLDELLKAFSSIDEQTSLHYCFSKAQHHYSIELSPDCLTATQSNNYSTNLALVEPAIIKKGKLKSQKSIKFCIKKQASWLSVGVCYLRFAKEKAFSFNSGSSGHGAYMACFNGYTWHHSDPEINSGYGTFNYKQGDVVTVTVMPNNKVVFQTTSCKPYEMELDQLPDEQLCFCVSLSSHQEQVTIVR